MIPISRVDLPTATTTKLADLTNHITSAAESDRVSRAHTLWKSNAAMKRALRQHLRMMAHGRHRCMYCGDNEGTDIDHYEPIVINPLRTFVWPNHLLACSVCNSHKKRDQFPLCRDGSALLLDPTTDDPFDHLVLSLSVGEYHPLTERGAATIRICDLNRPLLSRGRMQAKRVVVMALRIWRDAARSGDDSTMTEAVTAIQEQPLADVFYAMKRQAKSPMAEILFSDFPDIIPILRFTSLLRDVHAGPR